MLLMEHKDPSIALGIETTPNRSWKRTAYDPDTKDPVYG